ncbi:hypothetical protein FGG08_000566 [Glutinoglossum americanum]|uniref:Protein kinase domain-containing protein n=1 Tax=Glutinoglossum americanum TaxID=1670608 RepID=A0A9P8ICV2_9PEZI|nr:hypothetical protein FGG08_000566 [Glutinoglossum americanum]
MASPPSSGSKPTTPQPSSLGGVLPASDEKQICVEHPRHSALPSNAHKPAEAPHTRGQREGYDEDGQQPPVGDFITHTGEYPSLNSPTVPALQPAPLDPQSIIHNGRTQTPATGWTGAKRGQPNPATTTGFPRSSSLRSLRRPPSPLTSHRGNPVIQLTPQNRLDDSPNQGDQGDQGSIIGALGLGGETDTSEQAEFQSISTQSISTYYSARSKLSALTDSLASATNNLGGAFRRSPAESPYMMLVRERHLIGSHEDLLDWSGKGQHVEFAIGEKLPLTCGEVIGHTSSALVEVVRCRRIKLARKKMVCGRRLRLGTVMNEVQLLQRLRHPHIVQLVGTYLQGDSFAILLYPVAEYNMQTFLKHCTFTEVSTNEPLTYEQQRCWASLRRFFTCLLNALAYIHANNLKHRDIKPLNILVRGPVPRLAYQVYICDFGISSLFSDQDNSQTDGPTPKSVLYCAPEVYSHDKRGRSADVFSLGCVFLEMCTVLAGESVDAFADFRCLENEHDGDESFHGNPAQVGKWISKLRDERPTRFLPKILDCTKHMLRPILTERPSATDLVSLLPNKGRQSCCLSPRELYEAHNARDIDILHPRKLAEDILYQAAESAGLFSRGIVTRCSALNGLFCRIVAEILTPNGSPLTEKGTCRYADLGELVKNCAHTLERTKAALLKGVYTSPADPLILVLGCDEYGQSAFINLFLRKKARLGTKTCKIWKIKLGGETFYMVDTPSFNDSYGGNLAVLANIIEFICTCRLLGCNIRGIVYVTSDSYLTGVAAHNFYQIIKALCGDAYSNVAFVSLQQVQEETLAREEWQVSRFLGVESRFLDRFLDRFLCDLGSARAVLNLIRKDHIELQIEKEMQDLELKLRDTRAVQSMLTPQYPGFLQRDFYHVGLYGTVGGLSQRRSSYIMQLLHGNGVQDDYNLLGTVMKGLPLRGLTMPLREMMAQFEELEQELVGYETALGSFLPNNERGPRVLNPKSP